MYRCVFVMIADYIFNSENNYASSGMSLFLQDQHGLIDSIHKRHPEIWNLYKKMKSLDWDENEFDYSSCVVEFNTCSKITYDVMIKTLAWQWEADSVAAYNLLPIVAPFVSSTELWALWSRIGDNECLTGHHQVLTPKGWKRIDEVTEDDKVAQWDYTASNIRFVKPERIVVKDYEGQLIHFHDSDVSRVSQIVTPNHRMPIVYPYGIKQFNSTRQTAGEVEYDTTNAIPTSGFLSSSDRQLTSQECLYIAVQACGSLGNSYQSQYLLNSLDKEKEDRLLYLCNLCKWPVTSVVVDDIRHYSIQAPVAEYSNLANTFDWFNLDEIGYEWAVDFLSEVRWWNTAQSTEGPNRYYFKDVTCANKVITLAHMTGRQGRLTAILDMSDYAMPSDYCLTAKYTYQVDITNKSYVSGEAISKTMVDHNGKVYCLTVPTGYFMVKYNDAIGITGNCLHALTYSEIVRNSFENPDEVLESVLGETKALQRLETVANVFANVYEVSHKLSLGMIDRDSDEAYDAIMSFVVTMLILERIQFMASFAITFAIVDTGLFLPIGSAVQKICTDELQVHVETNKEIIKNELKTEKGYASYVANNNLYKKIIREVVESELKWTDYLFSDNAELVGLTSNLIKDWVLFNANDVYSFLDINNPFKVVKKNPLGYMNDWVDINSSQKSPQEEKVGNYLLGGLKNNTNDELFSVDF